MVCNGQTSRLEVANELLNLLNLERKIKINTVSSDFFSDKYFAPRPDCERLVNFKLDLKNMNIMRDWKISLKEYIEKDFKHLL